MKTLNAIKIEDKAIKKEKYNEVAKYVRAIIRKSERTKILSKKSFKDAQEELLNAHFDIDVMNCNNEIIYQVLTSNAEKYIKDKEQFLLLNQEILNLSPPKKELHSLCTTDKVHLYLIAHQISAAINLDDNFFKHIDFQIPFKQLYEKYCDKSYPMSHLKKDMRTYLYKLMGSEGELFYGIKVKNSDISTKDIMILMFAIENEKNVNKSYKSFTKFCQSLLFGGEIKYEIKRDQIADIGFHDLVVKCNVFHCIHKQHTITDITGIIHIKSDSGKEEQVKIPAGYCDDCNTFFILYSTYQQLINKGIVLCRIMDEKTYFNRNFLHGNKLARESLLMQYGYNVSQVNDIPDKQRHMILASVLDNKIFSKSEIISYLNFFIRQKQSRENMKLAVTKWKKDRSFVENYTKVEIKTIQ